MGLVLPTPKDVFFAGTLGGFQPDSCAGGGTTGAKCSGHEQFGTRKEKKKCGWVLVSSSPKDTGVVGDEGRDPEEQQAKEEVRFCRDLWWNRARRSRGRKRI